MQPILEKIRDSTFAAGYSKEPSSLQEQQLTLVMVLFASRKLHVLDHITDGV
jgi:hypothetical protein